MRFTILGSSGFIGKALSEYLKSEGHDVLEIKRDYFDHLDKPWGHAIYAIGLTADFRSKPFETVEAHVGLLSKVLKEASFDSFLYLSSTRVYLGSDSTDESTNLKVNPSNLSDIYNISKLLGESLCLNIRNNSIRVARLSNVVDMKDSSDNFIPSLIKEALLGEVILKSDLKSAKDYICLDDVVHLLSKISLHGKSRIYNVASGVLLKHSDWIKLLKKSTNCTVKVIENAPKNIHNIVRIDKIAKEFLFSPSCPKKAIFDSKSNLKGETYDRT